MSSRQGDRLATGKVATFLFTRVNLMQAGEKSCVRVCRNIV